MSEKHPPSVGDLRPKEVSIATTIERFVSLEKIPELSAHLLDHEARRNAFPGPRNALGYRSDEFDDRGDLNVAFIGCSWCEGMGVAREFIHSEQTKKILQDRTGLSVRSWNFGLAGTGIDYIARMVPIICHAARPDFVVLILPNGNRREYYAEDGRRINFYPAYRNHAARFVDADDHVLRDSVEALDRLSNFHDDIVKYIVQFRGISGVLDSYGIPWTHSWTTSESGRSRWQNTLAKSEAWDFSNYLGSVFHHVDVASDVDSHPGVKSHRQFAETVADWILQEANRPDRASPKPARASFFERVRRAVGSRKRDDEQSGPSEKPEADDNEIYPMW